MTSLNSSLIVGELLTLLSFSILLFVIYHFAWKPFNKNLEDRQQKIQSDISAAAKAKESSEQTKSELEERLTNAQIEANKIIRRANAEAEKLHDTILSETYQEQAHLIQSTEEDLELKRQSFARDMQESVVTMASAMAEKVLEREVSAQDHRQMIERFIQRLEQADEQTK
ncbi:F0F1 ATP synthase subunit B [Facklamia hominis]|uniref:F0F1 ATP synthase subunit B n=1 Tax=Facklamia hominis TaxID=178214 RepID=UPI0029D41A60|nr:F0F1 ATP synthase subunit B [Facklamia hominis]WPJ91704.1 F0F1 ATP synthase subunit B [Facklamia hominis]